MGSLLKVEGCIFFVGTAGRGRPEDSSSFLIGEGEFEVLGGSAGNGCAPCPVDG